MLRRLFFIAVFPLLLAAVLLALAQAYQAPLAASTAPTASTASAAKPAKPALLIFGDTGLAGIAGVADLSSEESEPLQASVPAARTPPERSQWQAAAHPRWPLRVPDEPLRPPMAQTLI